MQKFGHKSKDFIFNSCNDLKFAIYLLTASSAKLKINYLQVYRAEIVRMFEANLEHSLKIENCD